MIPGPLNADIRAGRASDLVDFVELEHAKELRRVQLHSFSVACVVDGVIYISVEVVGDGVVLTTVGIEHGLVVGL